MSCANSFAKGESPTSTIALPEGSIQSSITGKQSQQQQLEDYPTPVISNRYPEINVPVLDLPPVPLSSSLSTPSTLSNRTALFSRLDQEPLTIRPKQLIKQQQFAVSPAYVSQASSWRSLSLSVAVHISVLTTSLLKSRLRHSILRHRCQNRQSITGIRNYGQTCFLNAVLQALASLEPVIHYLDVVRELKEESQQLEDDSSFCRELWNVLVRINRGQTGIDTRVLLRMVGTHHSQFEVHNRQHDAQELLQSVLSMVTDPVDWKAYELCKQQQWHDERDELLSKRALLVHTDTIPEPLNSPAPSTISSLTSTTSYYSSSSSEDEHYFRREEKKQDAGDLNLFLPTIASEEHLGKPVPDDTTAPALRTAPLASAVALPPQKQQIRTLCPPPTTAMRLVLGSTNRLSPCPLSGWVGSALCCCACQHVRPIALSTSLDVPIIPVSNRICRLEDCLKQYTSLERVNDVECKNCSILQATSDCESEIQTLRETFEALSSSGKQDLEHLSNELALQRENLAVLQRASPDDDTPILLDHDKRQLKLLRRDVYKSLLIARLPAVLSIHVQRRMYDPESGRNSKVAQHVQFPEILNVAPFCAYTSPARQQVPLTGRVSGLSVPNLPIPYRLMAVIEHLGGPYSGHYVCYRRDRTGRWLWISDEMVRSTDWATVQKCQAYMLFYEAV